MLNSEHRNLKRWSIWCTIVEYCFWSLGYLSQNYSRGYFYLYDTSKSYEMDAWCQAYVVINLFYSSTHYQVAFLQIWQLLCRLKNILISISAIELKVCLNFKMERRCNHIKNLWRCIKLRVTSKLHITHFENDTQDVFYESYTTYK